MRKPRVLLCTEVGTVTLEVIKRGADLVVREVRKGSTSAHTQEWPCINATEALAIYKHRRELAQLQGA